jgi:hypothetical protein
MLHAIVLAATLTVERTPLDPAGAVIAVPQRRLVVLQRGDVLWTFSPVTGREQRVASDSMFADAKIEHAFAGGTHTYVSAGTSLYDVDRSRRLLIGYPLRAVHIAPDGNSAILETNGGPSIWLRFRDDEWKALPQSWSFYRQFARGGAWAVFFEDTESYDVRAVDMATGKLQLPQDPEHPQPTPEEPLVVSVDFGPEVDLGDEPPIESHDALRTRDTTEQAWLAVARKMTAELPPLTADEAKTLDSFSQPPLPRAHPSFDGSAAILELPVSMDEEKASGIKGLGFVPYRVKWYTILMLPDGSRHELQTRLSEADRYYLYEPGKEPPRSSRIVAIHLDISGNFLIVRENGLLERAVIKMP